MATVTELRPPVTYPRDAVVEMGHIAAAFNVSEEIVGKMDLPTFQAGRKTLAIWGQVLDVIGERALPSADKKLRRAS